ncbi:hypothetical protein PROFUN_14041 [Planoprotostelium fungivorum]|uniref:MPN domain-containing protein n=1 Tax=Planoprotostelium fungivorum TaxID=1890364 RepID=A0A2P6N279_9EUKA|nr:hypothetical protein PROFUN_14041 [Planoprotostelium fungivorum]
MTAVSPSDNTMLARSVVELTELAESVVKIDPNTPVLRCVEMHGSSIVTCDSYFYATKSLRLQADRYCTFVNTMRKIPGWAVTKKETKSELVNQTMKYVKEMETMNSLLKDMYQQIETDERMEREKRERDAREKELRDQMNELELERLERKKRTEQAKQPVDQLQMMKLREEVSQQQDHLLGRMGIKREEMIHQPVRENKYAGASELRDMSKRLEEIRPEQGIMIPGADRYSQEVATMQQSYVMNDVHPPPTIQPPPEDPQTRMLVEGLAQVQEKLESKRGGQAVPVDNPNGLLVDFDEAPRPIETHKRTDIQMPTDQPHIRKNHTSTSTDTTRTNGSEHYVSIEAATAAMQVPPGFDSGRTSVTTKQRPPTSNDNIHPRGTYGTPASLVPSKPSKPVDETRRVFVEMNMFDAFMRKAERNTRSNVETCGILAGELRGNVLYISTLIIPSQEGTSDTCAMLNEEDVFEYMDKHDLLTVGWIHSLLREAIAVVMAPTDSVKCGIFSLVDPGGLNVIQKCNQRGFHEHNPPSSTLYHNAPHNSEARGDYRLSIDYSWNKRRHKNGRKNMDDNGRVKCIIGCQEAEYLYMRTYFKEFQVCYCLVHGFLITML